MRAVVIQNAEIYTPDYIGKKDILSWDGKIARIESRVDWKALEALKVQYEIVDGRNCIVTPGWIDPHVHLTGASGEKGFSSQSPPIFLEELLRAGITTVVGTLGVNTSTSTMYSLYAKVKALLEDGLTAFLYTGGYDVPPMCIAGSVRNDLLYIDQVVGAGEIAISDRRSTQPEPHELARLVADAYIGGILSDKAGVTHFHVGEGKARLEILRKIIDEFEIEPASLYPTHVERTPELMREAIALVKKGAACDIDTVEGDLHKWIKYYRDHGGDEARLTVSSDSHYIRPAMRLEQVRDCVLHHRIPLKTILPFVTRNPANILRLDTVGEITIGKQTDFVVLDRKHLDLLHVIARGEWMIRDGELVKKQKYVKMSDRQIQLHGEKQS